MMTSISALAPASRTSVAWEGWWTDVQYLMTPLTNSFGYFDWSKRYTLGLWPGTFVSTGGAFLAPSGLCRRCRFCASAGLMLRTPGWLASAPIRLLAILGIRRMKMTDPAVARPAFVLERSLLLV